ncbi:MAG TPA: site-specific integrase [Candidatus Limnocylindria bacterium]|nr:site-specific integrase [Candidatus Limnocylindria bacterium]
MSRKQREPIRKILLADGTVRWRCVVDTGATADGHRRQATRTFSTMKEARAFIASTRVATTTGTYVAPVDTTVADYLNAWLESRRHSIRPKTLEGYRSALARAINAFGDQRLDRLTKGHLVDMINEMRSGRRPLAPRSVNLTLGVLRQAFNAAVREGILIRNPAALVSLLPEPREEMKAWTAEEAAAFLTATSDLLWAGPFALSLSGLRRGEVLGARWTDVTLEGPQPTIVVRRSRVQLGQVGGGVSEGEPKSARSRRSVPLAPYALTALRRTRSMQATHKLAAGPAYDDGDFVCSDELGRPPRPETYSNVFHRIADRAGLRRVRLHDLRHTSVTLMLGAGVPVHVVASIHGHDPVITQRIYAHTQTSDAVAAMAALDKILGAR